ncbi:MAG TPA: glycoside hydrolase family 88 protein, partial [Candidatus Acidoferrum sp.]|nr:glycoside hydrolase family 88 protein [Candidatus Acidoferrum sp.]
MIRPLAPCLLAAALVLSLNSSAQDADNGGISDSQIREVVMRVANHQIHSLADGDYSAVTNLDAAKAAREPEGIAWNYPWGVALFGMERMAEATGDKELNQFVVQHDQICSRYYEWLAGVEKQFGDDGKTFARGPKIKIKGLMTLGSLDSCGAMGNQMLVSMMDNPKDVSSKEKEVVERIADWVVHKQERLPDSTLWRQARNGGTLWPDDLYMGGVFLVRWGVYKHDQKFMDDAAEQIIHQAALEQDADGLWFHGYFMSQKQHAPFKWGRGNGWATVTLVETLSAMDGNDPLRPQ